MKCLALWTVSAGVLSALVAVPPAVASPPTAVTCGSVISAPGQYYLAGDCTGPGITISASNVHLKLNGHTMSGPGSFNGIAASAVSGLDIEGPGTITGYVIGIGFGGVDDSHVQNVTTTANNADQVSIDSSHADHFTNDVATHSIVTAGFGQHNSSNIYYDHVTASDNNSPGIYVGGGSTATHIDGSTADGNGAFGIFIESVSTGNHVDGNTALGNGIDDLGDGNPSCDNNNWHGNRFATANQSCIH